MVLLTDDCDFDDTILDMFVGGNGDYYLSLKQTNHDGKIIKIDFRVAMSGGNASTRTKLAIAELYRSLNE